MADLVSLPSTTSTQEESILVKGKPHAAVTVVNLHQHRHQPLPPSFSLTLSPNPAPSPRLQPPASHHRQHKLKEAPEVDEAGEVCRIEERSSCNTKFKI